MLGKFMRARKKHFLMLTGPFFLPIYISVQTSPCALERLSMLINKGSDLAYLNCDQRTLNDNKAHETSAYVAKNIHAESHD